MEEAYTIGVRLALDDGVSAGLAAIGAQMAVLDRAVTARLGELGRLQREGGAAVARPVAAAGRELPGGTAAEVPATVEADAVTGGGRPAVTAMPPAPVIPPMVRFAGVPADPPRPIVAPAPEPGERPAVADMRAASDWAGMPVPAVAPRPAPVVEAPMTQLAALASVLAPPPRVPEAPVAPVSASLTPIPRAIVEMEAAPVAPVATVGPAAAGEPVRMAPVAPESARTLPEVVPPMPATAAQPVAEAPHVQGAAQGGDVYLDGARMGRWIVDRLAREAERPQAGGTGFDGRMSPGWGGTV